MEGSLNLKVAIDDNSGFCFGVVYAIQMAEDYLDAHGYLYCLGDIVHNDEEVERLKKRGLITIDHEQFRNLRSERVLIRAHGEPPETYRIALENDIELIDASCPVVLKLQHRVKESFDSKASPIFIYGKHGHAEVAGLKGQTNEEAVVFQDISELENIDLPESATLFSQTTKNTETLYEIRDYFKKRGVELKFNDTICRQVSNRDVLLRDFVQKYDKIVFVAGTKSSNGKVLFNVCKKFNSHSHFVSSSDEIEKSWFSSNESVGICGATSTPMWLMEEVKQCLQKF
ncbi:MAG: 4-hydroxy-3-methylbut-2-enyl diphosphate reductase [Bacteroidia bacterium]